MDTFTDPDPLERSFASFVVTAAPDGWITG
jgi:hypothetical protein